MSIRIYILSCTLFLTLLLKINKYLLVNLSLLSTTSQRLLLFLLGNLRSLRLDLTGTGQRTVNFTLFNIFSKKHAKKNREYLLLMNNSS